MRKSPRFEEMDRIAKMRKHCSKCLAKDIKHGSYLGGNPSNFLKLCIINLIWLKFCVFLNSVEVV